MCGLKSRHSFLISVLFLLVLSAVSLQPCFSEVILTDTEAQTLMTEIQESQKELQELKDTYQQQNQFYKEQLTEERKQKEKYKKATIVTSTSSFILTVVCIIAIIL